VADRAGLPGLLHNRHIVNFHTAERKSDAGFLAYQLRFAKFILSMYYFHFIYQRMTSDDPAEVAALARASTWQPREPNEATAEPAYPLLLAVLLIDGVAVGGLIWGLAPVVLTAWAIVPSVLPVRWPVRTPEPAVD
jgi:hypothetical protein